jgi:hypothetical protein
VGLLLQVFQASPAVCHDLTMITMLTPPEKKDILQILEKRKIYRSEIAPKKDKYFSTYWPDIDHKRKVDMSKFISRCSHEPINTYVSILKRYQVEPGPFTRREVHEAEEVSGTEEGGETESSFEESPGHKEDKRNEKDIAETLASMHIASPPRMQSYSTPTRYLSPGGKLLTPARGQSPAPLSWMPSTSGSMSEVQEEGE